MNQKKIGQKISLVVAYIFYITAAITIVTAGYYAYTNGTDNPIFASLVASVVFFIGGGIVLHVIGSVSLPNLAINSTNNDNS